MTNTKRTTLMAIFVIICIVALGSPFAHQLMHPEQNKLILSDFKISIIVAAFSGLFAIVLSTYRK